MNYFRLLTVLTILLVLLAGCNSQNKSASNDNSSGSKLENYHQMTGYHPESYISGKILQVHRYDAGAYLCIDDNSQQIWAMTSNVSNFKVGEVVYIPKTEPILNLKSKQLNITFEKIIITPLVMTYHEGKILKYHLPDSKDNNSNGYLYCKIDDGSEQYWICVKPEFNNCDIVDVNNVKFLRNVVPDEEIDLSFKRKTNEEIKKIYVVFNIEPAQLPTN